MNKIISILILGTLLYSCGPNAGEKEPIINEGTISIAIDESLLPIMKAQINAYKWHYPKANINPIILEEQKSIPLLLKDSLTILVATREFNENELRVLKSRNIKYVPARMAIDAVALIKAKNSSDTIISIEQLKFLLTDKNSKTKLIFDRGNSSNLNLIMKKLNISEINIDNIYSAEGNINVIDLVNKFPGSIGFLGYNWISDTDDPKAMSYKDRFNLMAVSENKKEAYKPSLKNIKERNYAFERFIYLHTLKKTWGIENGFIRFCCSKIGQLVTEKMGLVPFYIMPKEYLLNTESMSSLQSKAVKK